MAERLPLERDVMRNNPKKASRRQIKIHLIHEIQILKLSNEGDGV